ncbi:core protein 20 [Lymphocystis disease virus 4]|uniref:Core protein 20 n=2 Tax=Lymphocystivirus TaxID=10494 RepID=A0A6B9XJT4_9VIRU|nr:core protein 20 [Lymphocystis disease virus 4]QHR78435.1 core protein 20 [Lymphocystis disease virus 4]
MAKINGKVIELPYIMNLEGFFKSVAFDLNSLPKFIEWLPKKPTSLKDLLIADHEYMIKDVLKDLIGATTFKFDSTTYESIDADLSECEALFTVFHVAKDEPAFKLLLKTERIFKKIDVDQIIKDAYKIEVNHKEEKRILKKEVEELLKAEAEFKSYPSTSYTELEPSKIRYTLRLGHHDLTKDELFNVLIPDDTVPLILSDRFVKTLRGFVHFDHEYLNEAILLKVNAEKLKLKPLKDPYKKYSDVAFVVKDNILYGTFDLPVGKRYVTREKFTERALSILKLQLDTQECVDVGYVAVFALLQQTMIVPVLADLVLTHPLVSRIVCIDESIRSHKKKPTAYLHFPGTDQTASVQEKTVERFNQYPDACEGDYVLTVRVKTVDQKQALKIRETISKIISIYNAEKNKIIDFYREYIPSFAKAELKKKPVKIKKIALKDVAPDIFIPTYSRQCLNIPEAVDSIDDLEDIPFMQFPIYGESQPRYYVCPYKSHPYPGLRVNNLSNKDKFPYIPCCYSKDQSKRKDSKWQMYFDRVKIESRSIADRNEYYIDILPPQLIDFFKSLTDLKLVRISGAYTDESAITACKWVYKEEMLPKDAVALRRSWAADEINAVVCAQELYATGEERQFNRLKEDFLSLEALDLDRYFRLLEEIFDVYIYCFDQKGPISWPSLGPHYRFKPKNKQVVLVYKSQTPRGIQYDLIVALTDLDRKGPIKNSVTSFSPLDAFVERLDDFISELDKIYINGQAVIPLFLKKLDIKAQKLDFYGKARVLIFSEFTLETQPLPPYYVPIYKEKETPKPDNPDVIKAVLGTRFKILSIDRDRIIGILDDCCECSVPLRYKTTEKIYHLKDFTRAEKTARLLKEYVKRLFALDYDLSKDLLKKDFVAFAENRIIIDPNHNYGSPFKSKFTDNFFLVDGKLVVPDRETIRRLMYYVYLEYSYDRSSFEKYKTISSIPNFFLNPVDFDLSDHYFITPVNAEGYFVDYEIYDVILPGDRITPYLFAYEDKAYLIQNCKNFEMASYIVNVWIKEGYNPGINKSYILDPSFSVNVVLWSKNKPLTRWVEIDVNNDSAVLIHKDYDGLEYAALLHL